MSKSWLPSSPGAREEALLNELATIRQELQALRQAFEGKAAQQALDERLAELEIEERLAEIDGEVRGTKKKKRWWRRGK